MVNDLLVERSPEREGMMDLGKNCSKCNRLDFLPFYCEYCKLVFCGDHRKLDAHECPGLEINERRSKSNKGGHYYEAAPVASLFPDREKDKQRIDEYIRTSKPKPTTILEAKQFKVGDAAKGKSNAFKKFNKFLNLQKDKLADKSNNGGIKKLFGKSNNTKTTKPNPIVDLQTLKRLARSNAKVSESDRVYVWCLFINAGEEEEDKLKNIDVTRQRKPMYLNKNWPIGRGLDVISDELKIPNNNNVTNEASERLNVFKLNNETPQLLNTSDRCKLLNNGEIIYLVKGTIDKD